MGAGVPGATSAPPYSLCIPAGHEHLEKWPLLPGLPVPRAGAEDADTSKSSPVPSEAPWRQQYPPASQRAEAILAPAGLMAAPGLEFSRLCLMG